VDQDPHSALLLDDLTPSASSAGKQREGKEGKGREVEWSGNAMEMNRIE
jgi:hypothetical protein